MSNKYGAKKVTIDGYKFDSQAEGERYNDLKLLVAAGEISDLFVHPVYVLIPPQRWNGKTYRAVKYIGDFEYFDYKANKMIIEDVKGGKATQTAAFKIKMKLWISQHNPANRDFRIVT